MEWFCTGPREGTRFELVEDNLNHIGQKFIKVSGVREFPILSSTSPWKISSTRLTGGLQTIPTTEGRALDYVLIGRLLSR